MTIRYSKTPIWKKKSQAENIELHVNYSSVTAALTLPSLDVFNSTPSNGLGGGTLINLETFIFFDL